MKGFIISELLIYDPTRPSPKKKPIQIDIQEAKIIAYYPNNNALEQKCNTVGMAEGVYSFCHTLLTGKQNKGEEEKQPGWQTVLMNCCTLILSEVQENIWIFVKLQHQEEAFYSRPNQLEENKYLDNSFTDNTCKLFMDHLYRSFKLFYGNIRGWVFRQRFQQLQQLLSSFVVEYHQVFKLESRLDLISYCMKDIRLVPLDVNSTLKFTYFKNVLQSYNQNIVHMLVFAYGALAYTSLGKNTTELFSKYFFSSGQPYIFTDQLKTRMKLLPQLPKVYISQKFRTIYSSRSIGFQQSKDPARGSMTISKLKQTDLLGLQGGNNFQLFDVYIQQDEVPLKVSFYGENSMLFVSFYKQNPTINELIFQNRFFHDNSDKFIVKINQSLPSLIKPNDPYKFLFHNCATFTGKSTIKQWKVIGLQIIKNFEVLQSNSEGLVVTTTPYGWICGIHRFSRILMLLIPIDIQLNRLDDYFGKMTKQYFTRAYV